ncbi:MAG: DUF5808 domain-containing protein [Bacillota bacterium]
MYDKSDRRIFVPKKSGLGYTLNFAHPVSWVIMALIIGVVVYKVMGR